jgi:hypothetical protein
MTELVSGAHADQPPFRPQRPEHTRRHRLGAAVMANLEHVDVAQSPVADQRIEHDCLRVPRQHCREALGLGLEHYARLVGRGVFDWRTRPHDGELHASDADYVPGDDLADIASADQLRRLSHPRRVAAQ